MSGPRQEFVRGDPAGIPGCVGLVGYAGDGLLEGTHLGVPGACLTFILSLDGPVVGSLDAADLASGRARSADIVLSGLHEQAAHIVQPRRQAGVQVTIDPLATRALFGCPAAALPAGVADPEDAAGALRGLWQRIGESPSWAERFDAMSTELARWAQTRERAQPRPQIAAAWRSLRRTRGTIGIDDLSRQVALSGRQLRTQFRREFGVGPKGAARLMRFEHAVARMTGAARAGRTPSLAAVAAACGYADQSHLNREFRGYLGVAPSRWLAQEHPHIRIGGHAYHEEWGT